MTKFFFVFFSQKGLLKKKKIALQSKKVVALNLYININELVYERRLMMKVFSMTKCVNFLLLLQNMLYFVK